ALMRMDGRIESVDFQKGGSMESSSADQVPITAVITYQRGVRIDENRDIRYIQNSLQRVLLSHGEIQEHIDFNDQGRLNYAINNEGRRSTIKIHGIGMVRHAAQLYEAGYCILIMLILLWIWKNKRNSLPEGFSFGLFMMMLWSLRFVDEFFKMNQEDFEADLSLNMGQWLSIPMFLLGLVVMLWSLKNGVKTEKG
ncbi:MAG: prolipoprotein diacylglyceryl transferase, partial [Cyclobacteriaceae bacterium]|nr:prolipoprotein diacylglyceryl transferase [Cyclobacteriaceae bacterium HetDA_MAG_MS6]